jgi:hypothetical protein
MSTRPPPRPIGPRRCPTAALRLIADDAESIIGTSSRLGQKRRRANGIRPHEISPRNGPANHRRRHLQEARAGGAGPGAGGGGRRHRGHGQRWNRVVASAPIASTEALASSSRRRHRSTGACRVAWPEHVWPADDGEGLQVEGAIGAMMAPGAGAEPSVFRTCCGRSVNLVAGARNHLRRTGQSRRHLQRQE